ncbi:hypothetical protein WJR50_34025 [Catalinimonas sp. 4WD22]|uniref:hypothetical protein n=1 Tax=Catalinimonas locisalis TaxID=3133978 RepID=UPI00310184B4
MKESKTANKSAHICIGRYQQSEAFSEARACNLLAVRHSSHLKLKEGMYEEGKVIFLASLLSAIPTKLVFETY